MNSLPIIHSLADKEMSSDELGVIECYQKVGRENYLLVSLDMELRINEMSTRDSRKSDHMTERVILDSKETG